ncbi:MAG: transglutaminase family protein [Aquimonas sp.]|nr:transglutaminase family protein [Aquimonas sp.]
MLLTISHDTHYHYAEAAWLVVQALRLWPAPSASQEVKSWRVSVDGRVLRPTCVDGFGNPAATHSIDQSVRELRLSVRGQVVTRDRSGVHGDDAAGLPPMFFLRSTELTALTPGIAALADEVAGEGTALERLHRLANGVRDRVDYVTDSTDVGTSAGEALAAGGGVCQDHAHVLISAARHLGFPSRYVSGYLCPMENVTEAASHAWAEIFVDDLGWVGFDAANRVAPDEHYVRVACGRDYRDAAPVRGLRRGGAEETLDVTVSITLSGERAQ